MNECKLTVLGTGHGAATKCYNTCFTIDNGTEYFLVDAGGGNGILKQLEDSNISLESISSMFISHTHTDHIIGAIWMIRMIGRKYLVEDYEKEFYIYGNIEVINTIKEMVKLLLPSKVYDLINKKIIMIELNSGDKYNILNKDITFFDIYAKKVRQFGFYMLLNNNEKFTFIGDEVCTDNTKQYVENSKYLFADAYMAGKEAEEYDPITRHHHSTVKYISKLANELNVKNLILSHTIDIDLDNRKEKFTSDSKKYFNGNIFVPNDLDIIKI